MIMVCLFIYFLAELLVFNKNHKSHLIIYKGVIYLKSCSVFLIAVVLTTLCHWLQLIA